MLAVNIVPSVASSEPPCQRWPCGISTVRLVPLGQEYVSDTNCNSFSAVVRSAKRCKCEEKFSSLLTSCKRHSFKIMSHNIFTFSLKGNNARDPCTYAGDVAIIKLVRFKSQFWNGRYIFSRYRCLTISLCQWTIIFLFFSLEDEYLGHVYFLK